MPGRQADSLTAVVFQSTVPYACGQLVSERIVRWGYTLFPRASLTLRASQGQGRRGACGVKGSLTEVWSSQGGGSVCTAVNTWSGKSAPGLTRVSEGRRGKTSLTVGS